MPKQTRGSLLIAAVSGRALARAAVDAGYTPLVADFFADLDARALAAGVRKVPGDISRGFQWETLEPVLESLCADAPSPITGLVYGSGFEYRPHLLEKIAKRWSLLGNDMSTVSATSDPATFFSALTRLSIPHPETRLDRPREARGWVAKRLGGAGGSHIAEAQDWMGPGTAYFQKLVPGRPVSALFVADRKTAALFGFSEQWTAPAEGKPWRYGGAAQPAALPEDIAGRIAEIVQNLTAAFGLIGLNSADFLLDSEGPRLLEINPRPGGTLDIFAGSTPPPLSVHLNSVLHGTLPAQVPAVGAAIASAVVFAPAALTIPAELDWPRWAADLPKAGERIDKERPICTVLARAGTMDQARQCVQARVGDLLTVLDTARTRSYTD